MSTPGRPKGEFRSAQHEGAPVSHAPPAPARRPSGWHLASLVVVTMAVGAYLLRFPGQPLALGLALLVAALAVAWRPLLLWWIVMGALPVLDLAPWTGRLFVDEFDLLLAVALAVAWARCPASMRPRQRDKLLWVAGWAVALSLLLGTLQALLPWPELDANAFGNLWSPFNALRLVRGAVWAGLLWALARRQGAAGLDVPRAFGHGLVVGLLGTVVFILAERAAFSHWFDFSDEYRIAGPFSAMHVGGAYVECFLVSTVPWLVARLLWPQGCGWLRVAGGLLLAGAAYALMVTFSRGGYAAFALGLALMLITLRKPAAVRLAGDRRSQASGWVLALLLALIGAVAAPVLMGSFAQSRLGEVDKDLLTREGHWRHSLALMDHDAGSLLLGMGVGRFPAVNLLRSPAENRSGTYALVDEAAARHLRLGSGQAIYIEQFVPISPGQQYRLRVTLRAAAPGATLQVNLCEKWLLTSFACVGATVSPGRDTGHWVTLEQALDSAQVGRTQAGLARPVKLSLNLTGGVPLDVASLSLMGPDGHELVHNGQFAQAMDHWFFTADNHLAWHSKSMPIAVLFDLGALGVLALGGLWLLGVVRAGNAAWQGQTSAAPLLASLLSFSAVGAIDTLIDTPRFLMLWLLLCCFAAAARPPTARSISPG